MVNSHAFRLEPARNVSRDCQAFARASWARSSASSRSPQSEREKARRNGIRPRRSLRKSSVASAIERGSPALALIKGSSKCFTGSVLLPLCGIDLLQKFEKIVGYRLLNHLVIDAAPFASDRTLARPRGDCLFPIGLFFSHVQIPTLAASRCSVPAS